MKGSGAPPADLGRHLLIGLEEHRWTSGLERRIRALRPGGVLFLTPTLRSPAATAELCARIVRALDDVPFLAIEEEAGAINPLRRWLPPLPPPRAVRGQIPAAARRRGEWVGRALRLLGLNTYLAAIPEASSSRSEPTPGSPRRARSSGKTVELDKAFVGGLAHVGALVCGKYFPGLSGARLDRSSRLLVVSKPMAEMWSGNLLPYRRLLSQLPLVMVSPAAYKAYDFDVLRPATVSAQVLEGLLRVKLGYRGVAVTDQLDSEYVCRAFDPVGFAVQALIAGCDLLLVHEWRTAEAVRAGLAKAFISEKLPSWRLEQAAKRLHSLTRHLSPPTGKVSSRAWSRLVREFMRFRTPDKIPEQKIA